MHVRVALCFPKKGAGLAGCQRDLFAKAPIKSTVSSQMSIFEEKSSRTRIPCEVVRAGLSSSFAVSWTMSWE